MYSTVLSRESISSVYAAVIPVRPLFATASFILPGTGIHTSSSVYTALLCAARAARAVFDCLVGGFSRHILSLPSRSRDFLFQSS